MKKIKLKWEVATTESSGFYRQRAWPSATIVGSDLPAFMIRCKDSYDITKAQGKTPHANLKLWYAKWYKREGQSDTFHWVVFKKEFDNLKELKEFADTYINSGDRTNVNS